MITKIIQEAFINCINDDHIKSRREDGEHIRYREDDGSLFTKESYLNNMRHGPQRYYYRDGTPAQVFYYIDDKEVTKEGWISYDRDKELDKLI